MMNTKEAGNKQLESGWADVVAWLRRNDLESQIDRFREAGLISLSLISHLTSSDLESLHIEPLGTRLVVISAVHSYRQSMVSDSYRERMQQRDEMQQQKTNARLMEIEQFRRSVSSVLAAIDTLNRTVETLITHTSNGVVSRDSNSQDSRRRVVEPSGPSKRIRLDQEPEVDSLSATISSSAFSADKNILKWFLRDDQSLQWSIDRSILAAKHGRKDVLEFALQHCPREKLWDSRTISAASYGNHPNLLKWLHENGCPWNEDCVWYAAREGHLDCIRVAVGSDCPMSARALVIAADRGHLDCVQWLVERGVEIDRRAPIAAAKEGHLDCLDYLKSSTNIELDIRVSQMAAFGGHINVLEWTRRVGCEWDGSVTAAAARSGRLQVLKWLHDRGCEWDARTVDEGLLGNHLGVVKYALKNNCPHTLDTKQVEDVLAI